MNYLTREDHIADVVTSKLQIIQTNQKNELCVSCLALKAV
jgi:hypothetical protein